MSVKQKKLSDEVKFRRELNKLQDEEDYLRSKNAIAMKRDIAERFGEYDSDPSVGGMYQRKKKSTKPKTKKKKGCGCK